MTDHSPMGQSVVSQIKDACLEAGRRMQFSPEDYGDQRILANLEATVGAILDQHTVRGPSV